MHWGTEGMACPDQNQLSLAPKLAAAGASIIIGAHAHMLQGSGWLGHTFVAYGMGNFLWWENSYSTATGVLKLTLHPHAPLTARFIPAVVSGTGQPIVDHGAAARRALAHYASLAHLRRAVREPARRGDHADVGRLIAVAARASSSAETSLALAAPIRRRRPAPGASRPVPRPCGPRGDRGDSSPPGLAPPVR